MNRKKDWTRISTATLVGLASLALFALPARAQTGGADLYSKKCAVCHGPDGAGATAVGKANKIRDLGSANVQQQSDADLTTIITAGKGKMPAYGKSLKPDQVKDLVAYIRTLKK
jgi:cytochrome c6